MDEQDKAGFIDALRDYTDSVGLRYFYILIYSLTEEIIWESNKTDISIMLNFSENTITLACNSFVDIKNCLNFVTVKALSELFEFTINNEHYVYEKGVLVSKTDIVDTDPGLLKIMFRPDKTIFSYENIDYYVILKRIRELAQLNENVKFFLSDDENTNVFQFSQGLEAMLIENFCYFDLGVSFDLGALNPSPLNINFVENDIEVSVSMIYRRNAEIRLSYLDNMRTFDDGTHVQGLYDGVFRAFKSYLENHSDSDIKIIKKDIIKRLNFVVHIKYNNPKIPKFSGVAMREITNKKYRVAVRNGVYIKLSEILQSDQSFLETSGVISSAEVMKLHQAKNYR